MFRFLSEIFQELYLTAILVVIDIFDNSLHTTLLPSATILIDQTWNLNLFIFQTWRHINDSWLLTCRNVMQYMEAGEEQQLIIKRIPVETRDIHNLLFGDIYVISKQTSIETQQGLNDALAFIIELIQMVQRFARCDKH